jgi:hypothetical protein
MQHETADSSDASRRQFLKAGVGGLVTGMLVAGAALAPQAGADGAPAAAPGGAPLPPWPYKKLDVDLVRRRGYEAYFKYACGYATAVALLQTLQETSGGPWNSLPPEMFRFSAGGGLHWGTLCGALNTCLAVLNLATPRFEELGDELMGWYTQFPFPSSAHEGYAKYKNQITTVSNSPLCHLSVSIWAVKAGARISEMAKKDRCAKLAGDTAAKTAELLNQDLENRVQLSYKPAKEFSHCLDCHQGKKSLLDNEQGKFSCLPCHDDHGGLTK